MDPAVWALIGSAFGAIALWAYNYHRPKVDYAKTGNDAMSAAIRELRALREDDRDTITRLEQRVDKAVVKANNAERRAEIAEKNAEYLAADMAKVTDHHLAVVRGVAAGTVPPWPPVPHGQNWLTDADYPPFVTARHHDTGVPGVDPNPPPHIED